MKIFETHAHLDFKQFDNDRADLIRKCLNNDIKYIINIGVDANSCKASINLAKKYKYIYAAVGFHPHDAKDYDEELIKDLLQNENVVAVGEIGLDYYRNLSAKKIQQKVFEAQIKLALKSNKPIIVHARDAHNDCLRILEKYKPPKVVFHSFTGNSEIANRILRNDWFFSFNGIITFRNNQLENVLRIVPMEKIFVETDSPYLSPVPRRGQRNTPMNLRYIIEKIAQIKRIAPKKVGEITFNNAIDFFQIKTDSDR